MLPVLSALLVIAAPHIAAAQTPSPPASQSPAPNVESKKWGILNKESYGLQKVTAVLPGEHSFSAAGFYAAITRGFYAEEGLAVRLLTPSEAGDPITAVLEKRAEFGLTGPRLLRAHSRGQPLILLATLWQNSPCTIYIHPDALILYPSDLAGRSIIATRDNEAPEILALLRREGVKSPAPDFLPPTPENLASFLQGKIPAAASCDPLFPIWARRHGLALRVMSPRSYGINFPSGFLFTSATLFKENHPVAAAFTRATLRGWNFALTYPSEIATTILTLPGVKERGITREMLLEEAQAISLLAQHTIISLGHTNPQRIQQAADEMRAAGLITGLFSIPDLLGTRAPPHQAPSWLLPAILALSIGAAAAGLIYLAASRGLAAAVSRGTAALRQSLEQAEAENRSKSAFLGAISGELAIPMLTMSATAKQLAQEPFDPQQHRLLELLTNSITRLEKITHDLLDLALIHSGSLTITRQPFDLRELLLPLIAEWKKRAEAKGIEFYSQLDPALPTLVLGDPARLRQVLCELLDNACKFTPSGSIILRVSPSATPQDEDRVVFCVRDTGPGIPPDTLNSLFKDWMPGDCSLTRSTGGAGLGLALAAGICRSLGGELQVQSEKNLGSEFFFTIPLPPAPPHTQTTTTAASPPDLPAPPDAEPSQPDSPSPQPGNDPAHPQQPATPSAEAAPSILVAEDSPSGQYVMRSLLIRLGCEVRVARSGAEVLKLAARERFDLILMDIEMPELSGIEAAKKLRPASGHNAHTPIIALSGYVDAATREACRKAGMDDFLAKPVQLNELARLLGKWLPNAKLRLPPS